MVKKLLAFLLTICMVVSMGIVPAFAMEPYEITYNIHSEGVNNVTAETGDIITVTFEMIRTDGDATTYFLNSYQNEIEYDMNFFELVESSIQMTYDHDPDLNLSPIRTTGQEIILATNTQVTHDKKHIVCTFDLKVIGTYGSGTVRTSEGFCSAWDDTTNKAIQNVITPKNLTVTIDPSSIVNVQGVTVSPTSKSLKVGETVQLVTTVSPQNATNKSVTYVSSNPSVATVSATGLVTAKAKGTTTITVTTVDGNKTATSVITVTSGSGGNTGGGGGGGGGETATKHTITFKNADGTDIKSVQYEAGTTVDLESHKPEKYGYDFEGWYTDKELTDKVVSIKLTKDIVLYAKWSKKDDVSPSKPNYHPDILTTEHYAYIIGREGNKVEPMANITRAEVATIFFRLLTEEVRNNNIIRTNGFADVNEGDWFNTAVSTLAKLEIVKGRSMDAFDPNANISRAEFTTIAARFSDVVYNGEDLFSDIDGHWAKDYINAAASIGWVVGDNGKFRPDDNITRAEVMTLVNRMLNRIPESEADLLNEMTRWVDNSNTNAWYYFAVQEATNSHKYEMKNDGVHEKWTSLSENSDWIEVEK